MAGFQTQELKHLLEGYLAEGRWGAEDTLPLPTKQTQRTNKNIIIHNKNHKLPRFNILSICSQTTGDKTVTSPLRIKSQDGPKYRPLCVKMVRVWAEGGTTAHVEGRELVGAGEVHGVHAALVA